MAARNEAYKNVCNSWVGHNINELIRQWGYPQQIGDMPNGNKVYIFLRSNSVQSKDPDIIVPVGKTMMVLSGDVSTTTYYCKTNIEATQDGRIVFWRFEGNSCR